MGAGDESEWPDRRSLALVKLGHSTNKFSLRHKQGAARGAGDGGRQRVLAFKEVRV